MKNLSFSLAGSRLAPVQTSCHKIPLHIARHELYPKTSLPPTQFLTIDSNHILLQIRSPAPLVPEGISPPITTLLLPPLSSPQLLRIGPFYEHNSCTWARSSWFASFPHIRQHNRSNAPATLRIRSLELILQKTASPRLLAANWQTVTTKSNENQHMRRRGRLRKANGSPDEPPNLI